MKLKARALTILSTLALTACGGGSSSNESLSNSISGSANGINSAEWSTYALGYNKDADYLFDKVTYISNKNDQYIRIDYLHDEAKMEDFDPNKFFFNFGDYLTDEGLYELDLSQKNEFGYKIGTLVSNKVTQRTYIPMSKLGLTDLHLTEKYEIVELDNKPLLDYIDTFTYLSATDSSLNKYSPFSEIYINKLRGRTFPKGATCMRTQKLSTNKNHIMMYKYPTGFSEHFDKDRFSRGYTESTLGGYKSFISKEIQENVSISAVALVNDQYRKGEYYKVGPYYNLDKEIQIEKKALNQMKSTAAYNQSQMKEQEIHLVALALECTAFNKIASQEIDKYRSIH